MSLYYFDTSAMVKQYIAEDGSDWIRQILLTGEEISPVFTSRLTVVEATCAFARRRREGTLPLSDYRQVLKSFKYDVQYRYNFLDVGFMVVDTAQRMADQHPLRSYDAVQLATAWLANRKLIQEGIESLIFICADNSLLEIAQAEGLRIDNPNRHL